MQLTLADGYSLTALAAVAAVALLMVVLLYGRLFQMLKGWQRWLLVGLRATAILLIVLLLFRPTLRYQSTQVDRPAVLFLLDKSRSMSIADDESGKSRFDLARGKLQQWQKKLGGDFRLSTLAFAQNPDVVKDTDSLARLAPDGEATSLSNVLTAAGKQFPPGEVAAAILLSDGIQNTVGKPAEAAGKSGVRVHAVGVGASLRSNRSFRDVQVTGITCPDRMLLGNLARVNASIDAIGLAGRVVTAFLDEDGREVAHSELTLDDIEGSQAVAFEFRPTSKGRHLYTVRIPPLVGERIVENNQRSAPAMVAESSIRVLYIEGTLRAEYGAMVDRFLARDPDVEFCALVQTRPNVFLQRSNMAGLRLATIPNDQSTIDKFDVFILGDLDHSYLKPAQQEMLLKRVREGGGLIMLGGYHSLGPGGYTNTPVGDALPVELGGTKLGQFVESFLPMLTPDGARHPIFANIADFFPTRQGGPKQPGLPTLDGCSRVAATRPAATVLATVSSENTMPVMAVQPQGKGRTAVFTADTTRKWQQGPEAMDRESPFLRFWGQTVRWLAGRSDDLAAQSGVDAQTNKASYEPGELVRVAAIVRTAQGQGVNDATVTVVVHGPNQFQTTVPLSLVPGPIGHYAATFEPPTAGHYELLVEAKSAMIAGNVEKIAIEVGRLNLEFERLDLDDKTLATVASATGGRYVPLSTADQLVEDLDRSQKRKIVVIERPLYWPLEFWVAFVLLLSTEWLLRRKFHLR